jgi:hypothetical protein
MTHKALIRQLQISCLGLDPIDPLRLLVDDVVEALREHAMREVQRLGQEIEQEPVACIYKNYLFMAHEFQSGQVPVDSQPLYTHPPQRTWVGLTDEEENEYNYLGPDMHWVIQEIAAKLKEKNT